MLGRLPRFIEVQRVLGAIGEPSNNSLLAGKLYWTGSTLTENAVKNQWDNLPVTTDFADLYLVRAAGSNLALAVVIKTSTAGAVLLVKAGQSIRMDYDGSFWS